MVAALSKYSWFFMILCVVNTYAEPHISNAISPINYFTGRDEQYVQINRSFSNGQKTLSLTGISGIGKTQLSRQYAQKNKHNYQIIWVFDGSDNINEQFMFLAKMINSTLCKNKNCSVSENVNESKKSVIQYLTPQNKWLLIFDNLKINDNDKIQDIVNWEHNGHIIFCSQDLKDLPQPIKIPYLNTLESRELLSKIVHIKDFNDADLLVDMFDGFPILIVQSALFLNDNQYIDVIEYKNIFKKSDDKITVHIDTVSSYLNETARNLMYKIAMLNNHKISKNILKIISNGTSETSEDIYHLVRFGILIQSNNDNIEFEMHDLVKNAVLEKIDLSAKKAYANELLDKFNHMTHLKKGSLYRYSTMVKDETMASNHEKLLANSEHYGADRYKIMELRKNLMDFYGINKDYTNCERMVSWLKEQEEKKALNLYDMSDDQKASYCWYLALMGMYDDAKYFKKAKIVLGMLADYPRITTGVYDIMALTYIAHGKLLEAESLIPSIEQVNQENLGNVNENRLFYVKARMCLAQERYQDALDFINKFIKEEEDYVKSTAGNTYYITKAEILNRMQRYGESNAIILPLYVKEVAKGIDIIPMISILTQLSMSELGLGAIDKSFKYMTIAKNLYNQELEKGSQEFTKHQDKLGDLLLLEGDILVAKGSYGDAIMVYKVAEKAYDKHFGLSTKVYQLSIVYLKLAQTALMIQDNFLYKQYLNKHDNLFGTEHQRTKKLFEMSL